MRHIKKTFLSLLAGAAVLIVAPVYHPGMAQQQPQSEQPGPIGDPVRELNLSPEQREKIRAIREQLKEERAAINQRLRETNQALEEVLDSDNPNDVVVEQRLHDVAEAQAASMRMRVLTEVRVRRVLTPEQLTTLRTLRQNARDFRRQRQLDNNYRRRERVDRQRGVLNQRNGAAPLFPRRGEANRNSRP